MSDPLVTVPVPVPPCDPPPMSEARHSDAPKERPAVASGSTGGRAAAALLTVPDDRAKSVPQQIVSGDDLLGQSRTGCQEKKLAIQTLIGDLNEMLPDRRRRQPLGATRTSATLPRPCSTTPCPTARSTPGNWTMSSCGPASLRCSVCPSLSGRSGLRTSLDRIWLNRRI